jgi:uncharacterized membrane protein
MLHLPNADLPLLNRWQRHKELSKLLLVASVFFVVLSILGLNYDYTLFMPYDHGLFNQLFWNNLHGHWFQSSLSSGNSVGVLQDGKPLDVAFLHWGQHVVPNFVLWLPFYAIAPNSTTLLIIQISLLTAGGLVLYALARHYLPAGLALLITTGYYGAGAVIGPVFDGFYEQCQIPLLGFGMLLALTKQRWIWFWLLTVLVLGIREDSGFIVFGIGLSLLLSRRAPRLGLLLCVISFAYVVFITNLFMPSFSADSSRLYLSRRFSQFVNEHPNPSTLQILWGMITHPGLLLAALWQYPALKAASLAMQTLPLGFVPLISPASWTLISVPLLSLLLQNTPAALNPSIRYTMVLIPGFFYGAILWWSAHLHRYKSWLRQFVIACVALSIFLALALNPHNVFYFLNPGSFRVPVTLSQQWHHAAEVRQMLDAIPPDASVAATSRIIPPLSSRRAIIRLPANQIVNNQKQIVTVEYLAADMWRLQHVYPSPKGEYARLQKAVLWLDQVIPAGTYGVQQVRDGAVLLQLGKPSQPEALAAWTALRQSLPEVKDSGWIERF